MIFYFSGTGNTKDIAKRIATATNDEIFAINEFSQPNSDIIGVCFPVYFSGLPIPVRDFFKKADFGKVKYLYAVATYGGSMGGANGQIAEILKKRNVTLNATFGIIMPDNYLPMFNPPSKEEAKKILEKSYSKIPEICEIINGRQNTEPPKKQPIFNKLMYKLYENGRKTKEFFATDDCIKCGLCKENCPSNAIEIGDTVTWTKSQCYFCMGCINRCPKKAIQYGLKTQNRGRYTNPNLPLDK